MKMPQLNRKYPSGAAKRWKKKAGQRLMKNVKISWTDCCYCEYSWAYRSNCYCRNHTTSFNI